ncbi:16S rRNA (guanine(966)-N(2))-methyltransferase RsmD [Marinobacter sp. AN1]|uniref:16S rRNA (guanine(966)-N(2))-methyltransferase RsmD n=1 Tax=Marinobacter sp. AN1 TaxID=2886046 RepID=UPI0022301EC0|nr:16S rRNA (guanine(966)-N(2))-methyltransferase RsmD [Marinobacter sp. AN1]UZD65505.1 16S rRNA (guanine(966)-N(2))-methyltransferase RsmD [Marinobacter sp. AN1]
MSRPRRPTPARNRRRTGPSADEGELRIIGGDWRSRVLRFPDEGGVRPTPARIRETLFNWLQFKVPGSRCLDLFSGSGVLGLEALSRGSREVTFVDHTPALARALRDNLRKLGSEDGRVECVDVQAFLQNRTGEDYDILFMDAPFHQGWLELLIPLIEENGWIGTGSRVYLEYESDRVAPSVPARWHLHRQKQAGQVTYALYHIVDAQAGLSE